jgi:spore germination protein YaaH
VLDDFNYSLTHQDAQVEVFEVLSTTTTRNRLIDAIVEEAVTLGLDGINLDFEAQPSKEIYHKYKQDFAQFVREMSVACRLNNLTFSIDNPVPNSNNTYLCRDVQGKVADYVIIMGYDEHLNSNGKASSAACINFVSNGIDDTLKLVPQEKVVNGIPFYGMLSKTMDDEVTYSDLIVKNVEDFLDRVGQTGIWDEEAQQLYAEWSSGGVKYQLWAETKESILVKLNVMRAKEISGVAVWCLGCETPDVWEAISAYLNS